MWILNLNHLNVSRKSSPLESNKITQDSVKSREIISFNKKKINKYSQLKNSSLLHKNQFEEIMFLIMKYGECYISQATLGDKLSYSREHINRTIHDNPLIKVTPRGLGETCLYTTPMFDKEDIEMLAIIDPFIGKIWGKYIKWVYESKTFKETVEILSNIRKYIPLKSIESFLRFSVEALNYAYGITMRNIKYCISGHIKDYDAYFYKICSNYEKYGP